MAIGLSNVNSRKAKRSSTGKSSSSDGSQAATPAELKSSEAWSTRGLAREGRSARRERGTTSGDLNAVWLDWTSCVAGTETPNRVLQTVRRILDLEMFVFEFLVYDLQIPERTKKRILEIRSNSARALQIRKLLSHHS